jgi:hypothetical protein
MNLAFFWLQIQIKIQIQIEKETGIEIETEIISYLVSISSKIILDILRLNKDAKFTHFKSMV